MTGDATDDTTEDSGDGVPFVLDSWDAGARIGVRRGAWTLVGYRYSAGDWRPHIYPLTAPNAQIPGLQKSITQLAPADHWHHRSVWWGHGDVAGTDFWLETPDAGRVEHAAITDTWDGPVAAGFEATASWITPGGLTLLHDRRRVEVSGLDGRGDEEYAVDVDYRLESATGDDVVLGRAVDSGFPALRVADIIDLLDGGHYLDSEGRRDFDTCDGVARWLCAWGELDPSPAARNATCSLAVFDHPDNAWSGSDGTTWFTRPFGWFTPAGTQDADRTVPAAAPLRFRHRLAVFAGEPDAEEIERWWAGFAAAPAP